MKMIRNRRKLIGYTEQKKKCEEYVAGINIHTIFNIKSRIKKSEATRKFTLTDQQSVFYYKRIR